MVGHTLAQWAWERPATTIQGDQRIPRPGPGDRAGGEHQQDQAVRVTLEELAVLQGFDSAFPFMGNKTQRSQQIGNAVPPPLAAAIVGALLGMDREIAA
jgi:DNA (cytosine-5)-methyltransferase 1